MKIRPISDVHLEFQPSINSLNKSKLQRIIERSILPMIDNEDETVLCIAGDLGQLHRPATWKWFLELVAPRFKAVIYVLGNHEFYGNNYFGRAKLLTSEIELPVNVHLLQNNFVIIEDTVFMGATFWTSMNDEDPTVMWDVSRGMNDYRMCKVGNRNLTVEETVESHWESRQFIFSLLNLYPSRKTVVVTHHAPSFLSVHPKFAGDNLNYAFASEYREKIDHYQPNLWIHGHMHDSVDYKIGESRIICNPHGYVTTMDENKHYNPNLVVEI